MPPLSDITNTRTFWKRAHENEYQRWWKPVGLVKENVVESGYKWPMHVTYPYIDTPSPNQRVIPINDAPDPPPEPCTRKKTKITREKAVIRSKRITPDDHVIRTRKIRAFPTTPQRKLLRNWADAARHTYNWALATFRKQENRHFNRSRINLKTRFVTCNESSIPKNKRWVKNTPYTVREGATNELSKAISDRLGDARRMKKPFRPPSFRSIKDDVKSIVIGTENFSKKAGRKWDFYTNTFPGKLKIRGRDRRRIIEKMPDGPIRAVRISMTRTGKVYLHVPVYIPKRIVLDSSKGHLVSLDPGSNPYMTYYSPTRHSAGSFGTSVDVGRFRGLQRRIDQINSVTDKNNGSANWITEKKRMKLREKGLRIRERARNLACEATDKTITFLVNNFQYIHASTFETSRMVRRTNEDTSRTRSIRRQTVRDLHGWLHYPFKTKIKDKMEAITGLVVEVESESYTTKTCDACGSTRDIGGTKTWKCVQCHHTLHRDVHGARNHALRNCVARYTLI